MNRAALLDAVAAGRARFEQALARIPAEKMREPLLDGGRSVKDLLAHVAFWEARVVEIYRALAAGRDPGPIGEDSVERVNARVVEEWRARPLEETRAFARGAYADLIALIEAAPEGDLFDAERFAFTEGRPFAEIITWNAHDHYDEHAVELLRLAERLVGAGSSAALAAGEAFLRAAGRDIDRAVFGYAFRGQPVESVLDALARYQNPDGGFFGLEVDIAAPVSNPFASELALRILTWVDPPRDHPVVARLVEHLEGAQDEDGCWRFTPEVYQSALAPWFQGWQWPNLNPSGQIAGELKMLGLGSERLHARVERLFERLARPADLTGSAFYEVLPYALYYQTEWAFAPAELHRWGVVWWLIGQQARPPESGAMDAGHFFELAPRPNLAVARRLPPEILAERLDALRAEQQPDGGWPTPYNPAWRPWATISSLLALQAYGRLG